MTHSLHRLHHDGSPAYLSDEAPALGDTVTVRVRTHDMDLPDRIWVRTTYDAEPIYHPCTRDGDWWSGDLAIHNPLTHYRFLLAYADRQTWLTAAGLMDHDGPDTFDFVLSATAAAPDWGRDTVVYQISPTVSPAPARPTPGRCRRGRSRPPGTTTSTGSCPTSTPPASCSAGTSVGSSTTSTTSRRSEPPPST